MKGDSGKFVSNDTSPSLISSSSTRKERTTDIGIPAGGTFSSPSTVPGVSGRDTPLSSVRGDGGGGERDVDLPIEASESCERKGIGLNIGVVACERASLESWLTHGGEDGSSA